MKVFISGHPLYNYLDSIAEGFRQNDCNVKIFKHKNTNVLKLLQRNYLKKIKSKFEINKINKNLQKEVKEFNPDIFLAINGEVLLKQTIQFINKISVSALWVVDGVSNIKLPLQSMELFHLQFIFEPTDKKTLKNAIYLPYACQPSIYFKQKLKKKYDISFVGSGHIDRLEILNQIAEFCEKQTLIFAVFGPFNIFKDKSIINKYPALYKSIKINEKLDPKQVNTIYNETIININIHHSQSKEGINPRVFEIFCSKNLQLLENKIILKKIFPEIPSIFKYNNLPELFEKIQILLLDANKYNEKLDFLHATIKKKHTFLNRAFKIIELYEKEKQCLS
ncbi:MAG: hypothetical protein U9O87_04395 [Verrucomicrobiota bacterium]|nr:hypothetical protein [Verrucomicrobiota bacterium]